MSKTININKLVYPDADPHNIIPIWCSRLFLLSGSESDIIVKVRAGG